MIKNQNNFKRLSFFLLLAIAFFLRFYRISTVAPFLGDQGRDLLEIYQALSQKSLPLAGPLSNLGVHAGPIYYYLLIPSLILTRFHPIGPTLFSTFLDILTLSLLFKLGSRWFGFGPSFLSGLLYTTSPLVISQRQGIWNPIPIPFFTLLLLLSFAKVKEEKAFGWLALGGIFLGILIQLYPPAYLFLFLSLLGWIWLFFKTPKKERVTFFRWSFLGFFGFFLSLVPFVIFQFQNEFFDFKNLLLTVFKIFFTSSSTPFSLGAKFQTIILSLSQLFEDLSVLFKELKLSFPLGLTFVFLPFVLGQKDKKNQFWRSFFLVWLVLGLLFSLAYSGEIQKHYLSPLWLLPFFFLASFINLFWSSSFLRAFFILLIISLGLFNFYFYLSHLSPANNLLQAESTAQLISQEVKNQPLALLLVSPRSPSDAHLRYFLVLKRAKLIQAANPEVENLVLVCDQEVCPEEKALETATFIESECLPVCPPLDQQKEISLASWQLTHSQKVLKQKIYFLTRKGLPKEKN